MIIAKDILSVSIWVVFAMSLSNYNKEITTHYPKSGVIS